MGCVFGKEASKRKEEVEFARAEEGVVQNCGNVKEGGEEEKSKRPKVFRTCFLFLLQFSNLFYLFNFGNKKIE